MNPIATAADYADALLIARTVRTWILRVLALILLAQLALFFTCRYSRILAPAAPPAPAIAATAPASPPATAHAATPAPSDRPLLQALVHYTLGLCSFVALILVLVLVVDLFLIAHIMLVGRLIGVSHVIRAFFWSVLLALLMFPWQAFLDNANLTALDFKIPGVLYTWEELVRFARFDNASFQLALLRWSRFLGFPILSLVLLLVVQSRSSRGLRLAMGEEQPPETPEP